MGGMTVGMSIFVGVGGSGVEDAITTDEATILVVVVSLASRLNCNVI